MMQVKATREGRIGETTASGYVIDAQRLFVALPSHRALRRFVALRNPANTFECAAEVLDVGPWNEHDDAYVFGGARPLAESGVSLSMQGTNGAGIDLGEAVWQTLGMKDNSDVEWEFEPTQ